MDGLVLGVGSFLTLLVFQLDIPIAFEWRVLSFVQSFIGLECNIPTYCFLGRILLISCIAAEVDGLRALALTLSWGVKAIPQASRQTSHFLRLGPFCLFIAVFISK